MTHTDRSEPAKGVVDVAEWRKAMEGVTPGEWSASEQKGLPRRCFLAQVFQGEEGRSIACLDATSDEAEASRTAAWIARCSPAGISALLDTLEANARELAVRDWQIKCMEQTIANSAATAESATLQRDEMEKALRVERERVKALEAGLRCAQQQCETAVYNITQREHDEAVVRSFQSIADFCARSVLAQGGDRG